MKKYEAIKLSYNGNKENDPSKKGFSTEDEAWGYVKEHICEYCKKIWELEEHGDMCSAEWMVDEYKEN